MPRHKSVVQEQNAEPVAEVAKDIAEAAPKTTALVERVEKLEKCLVLVCNEIGLRLGEPLKSNFANIILTGNEPGLRKK